MARSVSEVEALGQETARSEETPMERCLQRETEKESEETPVDSNTDRENGNGRFRLEEQLAFKLSFDEMIYLCDLHGRCSVQLTQAHQDDPVSKKILIQTHEQDTAGRLESSYIQSSRMN